MARRTGDLLALGLFLLALSYILSYFGLIEGLTHIIGLIGAVTILIVEGLFMYEKWLK